MHHQRIFAITELINRVIYTTGLSERDFVRALGYANLNKGLRRLESWREKGTGDADFLKRVSQQFSVPESELQQSLIRTIGQLSDEW